MIETITRDDGTRLATVTIGAEGDGDANVNDRRATLTMFAPDGAATRAVPWALTRYELDRLVNGLDKAAVELCCAPPVEAAA